MQRALLLLTFTLSGLVPGEGFISRIRRQSENPMESCWEDQVECLFPKINPYGLDDLPGVQRLLANSSRLAQFGLAVREVGDCYQELAQRPGCSSVQKDVFVPHFAADYIASPGAVEKLLAVSSSPCVLEDEQLSQVGNAFEDCDKALEAANQRGDDKCDNYMQLWSCWETESARVCGQAAGDLITHFKQFALSPDRAPEFLQYMTDNTGLEVSQCSDQVV